MSTFLYVNRSHTGGWFFFFTLWTGFCLASFTEHSYSETQPHSCMLLILLCFLLPRSILWSVAIVQSLSHVRLSCDPMDCSPPGSSVHGFPEQEHWSGLSFPSPGDLPNPEIKPASPASAGRLPATEAPGKPIRRCARVCAVLSNSW